MKKKNRERIIKIGWLLVALMLIGMGMAMFKTGWIPKFKNLTGPVGGVILISVGVLLLGLYLFARDKLVDGKSRGKKEKKTVRS